MNKNIIKYLENSRTFKEKIKLKQRTVVPTGNE
jgi:hypothetical protein